ncbi:MAG: biotin--[acetyl-CoA-carboxylase] ligase [Spirochaetales bacterium]|nr:biotin--[acetyl-CoA-carboxylase] ligase [Spirochaetales bacterium]
MQQHTFTSPIGGAPIYYLPETESTMSVARAVVADGAPSGVVILTDFQTAGRGRLPDRQWVSPAGESLMFTVAIKEPKPRAMPLRAGLAVALTLESICNLRPQLKWPNDVLVADRKVCGILCEYSEPWLYVGIGLNVLQRHFPEDLAGRATSVALETEVARGVLPDRDLLLKGILSQLGDEQSDWREQVDRRLWRKGERTTIARVDGSRLVGTVVGVDEEGSLIVARAGTQIRIAAGELSFFGESGEAPRLRARSQALSEALPKVGWTGGDQSLQPPRSRHP